ncbi:MAG: class I SAM-dependent methyltransferase [Acidimicrobiia bacterium]
MEFETKSDGVPFGSDDYSPRHAEVFANRYDDGLGNCKIATFRRLLGPLTGVRVLDVGSGEGTFSRIAREQGAEVVAADFAEAMVQATATRAQVPVIRGSAESLPCATDSFDVVVALDIIEHLYRPKQALDDFHRVLRPNGRLVLATDRDGFSLGFVPLRLPKPVKRVLLRRRLDGTALDRDRYRTPLCTHTHEFALDELLELAGGHGFRLEHLDTYPHQADYGGWGRLTETALRGRLRRWKWNYVMVVLTAV